MNIAFARISTLGFVTFALAFGATACVVEEGTPDSVISQESVAEERLRGASVDPQGIVHFESPKAFFDAIDEVARMPIAELDVWEESHGFVSQRRLYGQIMTQVANAPSLEAAEAILLANDDIIEVHDDVADLRIVAQGYSALVGREGIFYVNGTIHKVLPDVVIASQDGRYETIEATMASLRKTGFAHLEQVTRPQEGVQVIKYKDANALEQSSLVQQGCTDYKSSYLFSSDGTRRADIELVTWPYTCTDCCGNTYWQVKAEGHIRGAKKVLFGAWDYNYNTTYDWKNIEFEMTAPKGIAGYGDNVSYWQFNYASYTKSITSGTTGGEVKGWYTFASWNVGDQIKNSTIQAPYFNKVKGQGQSRGTGSTGWAEICCGYVGGCNFTPICVPRTTCYAGECGYVSNGCGSTLYCGVCGGGGGGGCIRTNADGRTNFVQDCAPGAQ